MRRILSIDGGGLMGIIPAVFLSGVESLLVRTGRRRPLGQRFDLIAGTSTGAILGAALASGHRASKCADMYLGPGTELFRDSDHRNWRVRRPWRGIYRRKDFLKVFARLIQSGPMRKLRTRYMATSVSLVDGRTHYFKSDDRRDTGKHGPPDADLEVLDVVARSGLSAPYYFEPVDDPVGKQVWIDGGSGTQNCPFEECIVEAIRRGWTKEEVRILSLGTGYSDTSRAYRKAEGRQSWRSVRDYLGLARTRSIPNQFDRWGKGWKKLLPNVKMRRVDIQVPEEVNVIDGGEHARAYHEFGIMLVETMAAKTASFLGGE